MSESRRNSTGFQAPQNGSTNVSGFPGIQLQGFTWVAHQQRYNNGMLGPHRSPNRGAAASPKYYYKAFTWVSHQQEDKNGAQKLIGLPPDTVGVPDSNRHSKQAGTDWHAHWLFLLGLQGLVCGVRLGLAVSSWLAYPSRG
jgi:hypothetical protein